MGHYEKLFIRFVTVIRLSFIIIANPPFNYFTLLNIGREANNASLQHLHLTIFQKTRKKSDHFSKTVQPSAELHHIHTG